MIRKGKPVIQDASQTRPSTDLIDSPVWDRECRLWPPGVRQAAWQQVSRPLRQALVSAIQEKRFPIYLHGIQGCGKSSAMACLYRSFQGTARWILLESFVQQITRCRQDGRVEIFSEATGESFFRTEVQWFKLVSQAQLLCIDDIGLRPPTESAYEIVFKLINSRLGLPTIYTSNLDEEAFQKTYGMRIASRVFSGTVIQCSGHDRRTEGRKVIKT